MLYMPAPMYTVSHTTTFTGSARHLIELRVPATLVCAGLEAWVTQESTVSHQIRFRVAVYATQGSSGTALTEERHQLQFSTPLITAVALPTTGNQSTSATPNEFDVRGANHLGNGYIWNGWGQGYLVGDGTARTLALETLSAATTQIYTFGMKWAELRGVAG